MLYVGLFKLGNEPLVSIKDGNFLMTLPTMEFLNFPALVSWFVEQKMAGFFGTKMLRMLLFIASIITVLTRWRLKLGTCKTSLLTSQTAHSPSSLDWPTCLMLFSLYV
jgi:hypothetical protein